MTAVFGDTAQSYWQKVTLMMSLASASSFNPWDFEDMLDAYYLNNGLYDTVQQSLYEGAIWTEGMKPLRNPAHRAVEFHVSHLWPGRLETALPIVVDKKNERIVPAIQKVWTWSNWAAKKQLATRWLSNKGTMYVKVVTRKNGLGAVDGVYFQLLKPQSVTELVSDERDFLTFIRLDTAVTGEDGTAKTRTEIWDKAAGDCKVYEHGQGRTADVDRLGNPIKVTTFEEMQIDFIPITHAKFQDVGEERGLGVFVHALDKIDEAARMATRLHQILFRYNKPTKAISANGLDAQGKPLPPPRLTDTDGNLVESGDTANSTDEDIVTLPGMAQMQYLIPPINYAAALSILQDQMDELEQDLPEIAYYHLKADANVSGKALRTKISGAIDRCLDARGNAEAALVRADQMALTIGKAHNLEGFRDLGEYENGDFDHSFAERDVLPMDKSEKAEIFRSFTSGGMPKGSAAKRAGLSQTEIDEMLAEEDADRKKQQASLGQTLLEMQRNRDQGK